MEKEINRNYFRKVTKKRMGTSYFRNTGWRFKITRKNGVFYFKFWIY